MDREALRKRRVPDGPRRLGTLSDSECLTRVARGDSAAFAEIVRRYQDRVVNLVYRVVGDWDLALDLAQDAFFRVHRRATTFKPEGNARAWLLTVAVNVARDHLRKQRRIVFLDRVEGMVGSGEERRGIRPASTPPELLEQEELRERVQIAIGRMQEFQKMMLLLRDFEGLSYEEIAGVLDCEVGTVKSRIHRARKQFQAIYEEMEMGR